MYNCLSQVSFGNLIVCFIFAAQHFERISEQNGRVIALPEPTDVYDFDPHIPRAPLGITPPQVRF